jgi:hypothetical protein
VPARGTPRHRAGPTSPPALPVRQTLSGREALARRGVLSDRGALSRVRHGSQRWPDVTSGAGVRPGSEPGVAGPAHEIRFGSGPDDSMWPGGPAAVLAAAAGGGTSADVVPGGVSATGGMAAAGYVAVDGPGRPVGTFHDEVVRTSADLDAILALAGVTGAGVGAHLGYPDDFPVPEVPDTPEGVESPRRVGVRHGWHAEPDGRAERDSGVGVDDSSIIAGGRRSI